MEIQPFRHTPQFCHAEVKKRRRLFLLLILALIVLSGMVLLSCMGDGELIDKPDEFTRVYEANEKIILRAIAQVYKDKAFGKATINVDKNEVTSDDVIQGEWKTRSIARVRKINWKEREVMLSVITEKKTPTGWEMRRLLEKDQYNKFFDAIDSQIYQEMYKTE